MVFAGVVLAYALTGRLGLQLSFVNSNVTLVWPPTGIATAALLLFGIRHWSAVYAKVLSGYRGVIVGTIVLFLQAGVALHRSAPV